MRLKIAASVLRQSAEGQNRPLKGRIGARPLDSSRFAGQSVIRICDMLARASVVSIVVLALALLIAIVSTRYLSTSSVSQDTRKAYSTTQTLKKRAMDNVRPIAGVKRVMVFGGTGMVGKGIMRECLNDPDVEEVVTVGRTATGVVHDKLREIVHADMLDLAPIDDELKNVDACIWSLGVSSTEVNETVYEKVTKQYTLSAANALIKHNPNMTFVLISAMGADSSAKSGWPRVKGETEDAIMQMPWHGYAFRPAMIRSMHGEVSRTTAYRIGYIFLKPIVALTHFFAPSLLTTTETLGQGFLHLAKHGSADGKQCFTNNEINLISKPSTAKLQ